MPHKTAKSQSRKSAPSKRSRKSKYSDSESGENDNPCVLIKSGAQFSSRCTNNFPSRVEEQSECDTRSPTPDPEQKHKDIQSRIENALKRKRAAYAYTTAIFDISALLLLQ
jgi:hypothetical protein